MQFDQNITLFNIEIQAIDSHTTLWKIRIPNPLFGYRSLFVFAHLLFSFEVAFFVLEVIERSPHLAR